jgi:hypothetical protein
VCVEALSLKSSTTTKKNKTKPKNCTNSKKANLAVWWHVLIVPTTQEAEAGGSLKPKSLRPAECRWLMPIILATQEAKVRGSRLKANPGK